MISNFKRYSRKSHSGLTLLELLIVVGVLVIVGAIVVIILNPLELFKQSRDSRRISDLQAIDSAISIFTTEVGGSLRAGGTPFAIYISLPDSNNNCNNYPSLPSLNPPQKYICADENNLRKADENGWIQINFTKIPSNSLAVLPLDPVNSVTGGMYYTLVTDGKKWELTSVLESDKNKGVDKTGGKDGGLNDNLYELGTNLTLTPAAVLNR